MRLVLFGDLHQLPPVVQESEVAEHLESAYGGPFFFSVPALREGEGVALLELTHVFRQREGALLTVLNRVRDGEADVEDLAGPQRARGADPHAGRGRAVRHPDADQCGGAPHQRGISRRPAGQARANTRLR